MKNLPAKLPPWSAKAVSVVGRSCNAVIVSGTACRAVRGAGATCETGVTNACVLRARTSARAVVRSMVVVLAAMPAAFYCKYATAVQMIAPTDAI